MSVWITRLKDFLYEKPLVQRFFFPVLVNRYLKRWVAAGPRVKGTGLNVVVLNHCYDQDIEAICKAGNGTETIWVLESGNVFRMVHTFVPTAISGSNPPNESPEMAPHIERYRREFIKPLADLIIKTTGLEVFLTPSDLFFWLRPLILEFQERGIPVVVQDKEGSLAPSPMLDAHVDWLKEQFPPIADAFLYWNQRQLDMAIRSGVPKERAVLVGQPRSDYFFHPDRWMTRTALGLPVNAKVILFFTFGAATYTMADLDGTSTERPWGTLRREVGDVLERVARRHPETFLVIKAHPQQPDLWEDFDSWRARGLPNARFITGAYAANALIVRSDVVVGFQTTAMIEAMTTGKPVIYTGWGETHASLAHELLPIPASGGCDIPSSPEDFEERLESRLAGSGTVEPAQRDARGRFLGHYLAKADGNVSRRILDYLHSSARERGSVPC